MQMLLIPQLIKKITAWFVIGKVNTFSMCKLTFAVVIKIHMIMVCGTVLACYMWEELSY